MFLIFTQVLAVIVGTYLLLLEKEYCEHCYGWSNIGAWIIFIFYLIPFLGILLSILGCAYYATNIIEELTK